MAKPVLIIEFCRDFVRAGIFAARRLTPLNYFSKPRTGDTHGALSALLAEIKSNGFDAFSRVAVSLPADLISIRVITFPFSDAKKVNAVIPFETRELFVKDSADLVLETLRLSGDRTLVAAVEKDVLRQFLGILKELSINPVWLGLSLFSKDRLVKRLYTGEDTAALLDNNSLTAVTGPSPCLFKAIKDPMDVSLALSYAHAGGAEIKRLYASSGAAKMAATAGMDVTLTDEYGDENNGLLAMALHLGEGLGDAVNFRKGEFAGTVEAKSVKRRVQAAIVMIAALAGLSAGLLYLRHTTLDSALEQLDASLERGYMELFKGEAKVIDPLYQLEAKIKALNDEEQMLKDRVDVLRVMNELALSVNKGEKLRLYKIEMRPGMVIAGGETVSFEAANKFRDALSKRAYFKDITLTDVKGKADGGVSFSISMTFRDTV